MLAKEKYILDDLIGGNKVQFIALPHKMFQNRIET